MESSEVYRSLVAAHREILEDPRYSVEDLDRAACGPQVKHLAQFAIAAAAEGRTAAQWRDALAEEAGPEVEPLMAQAEECMRRSGLWPWQEGVASS